MTDLIERLRKPQSIFWGGHNGEDSPHPLLLEAADEIERLTADLNESERQTRAQLSRVMKRDAEIERLRKRLKEHKLHNSDLRAVVDRVAHLPPGHICDARWIALAALEDEYTIKIKGIPSKLEPPEDDDE